MRRLALTFTCIWSLLACCYANAWECIQAKPPYEAYVSRVYDKADAVFEGAVESIEGEYFVTVLGVWKGQALSRIRLTYPPMRSPGSYGGSSVYFVAGPDALGAYVPFHLCLDERQFSAEARRAHIVALHGEPVPPDPTSQHRAAIWFVSISFMCLICVSAIVPALPWAAVRYGV